MTALEIYNEKMTKEEIAKKIIELINQRKKLDTDKYGNFLDVYEADKNLVKTEILLVRLVHMILKSSAKIRAINLFYGFKYRNALRFDFYICETLQGIGIDCYTTSTGIGFIGTVAGLNFNHESITADFTKYNDETDRFRL